jgi:diaminohydroxyphosphoribosylaminopyrimidine deaminase/5-amino-6-(5-phosphoribosylamino)uracil reductase
MGGLALIGGSSRLPMRRPGCFRQRNRTGTGTHPALPSPALSRGGLEVPALLAHLAGQGVTRVLVEGGAKVARSFLQYDLVDELLLFRSPVALGGDLLPALGGLPVSWIEEAGRFRRVDHRRFGSDRMSRYERVR